MSNYNRRAVSIFFLGISSGLPFLLILQTLSVWLAETGVSKLAIGYMALATLPYSCKLFWAPLIDRIKIPILGALLGQRRSWLLLAQLALALSIIALGNSDPANNIISTALCALIVGFCAASQDIVIEAYRIETLPPHKSGYGVSASVIGYRVGMLIGGAGALYLAHFLGWHIAYNIMAGCMLLGVCTTLLSPEPLLELTTTTTAATQQGINLLQIIKDFIRKRNWLIIITFLFCYKFADIAIQSMSMPFLVELGFTKLEIAHVAKFFGTTAMIVGGIVSGIILMRYSLWTALLICCSLQFIAVLLFEAQAIAGNNFTLLWLTMGMENFVCGMGQVVLISYLSSLCSKSHTASHYAIVASLASLMRVLLSVLAGFLANNLSWVSFYQVVALGCLPVLIIVLLCATHFSNSASVRGALA